MIDVAVITNGRSTLKYTVDLVTKQTVDVNILLVRGSDWITANNTILTQMKGLYFRVDDDMFLHPMAFEFMLDTYTGAIAHTAKLYEHFAKRIGGKIKLYDSNKVKKIGGFRPNKLGKIDRTFAKDVKNAGIEITTAGKRSPVGIHACAPWEEQLKYERLWGYKKAARNFMKNYNKSIEWQAEKMVTLVDRQNKKEKSKFWKWQKSKI